MTRPQQRHSHRMILDADLLMKAAGVVHPIQQPIQPKVIHSILACTEADYALPNEMGLTAKPAVSVKTSSANHQNRYGQGADFQGIGAGEWLSDAREKMAFATEVLRDIGLRLAASRVLAWESVLPNGFSFERHSRQSLVKQALATFQQPPVQPMPLAQAHQAMNSFMKGPATAPQPSPVAMPPAQPTVGASPIAPGHPTMTGVPQRAIGLDSPVDTSATPLPGAPGHAATNVIDQQGGLDPKGLTVDGNNAAGIKKFGKFLTVQDLDAVSEAKKKGWPQPGLLLEPGERCQQCGAIHERGDDGKCNSCGGAHDKQAAFSVAKWLLCKEKQAFDMQTVQHHMPRIRPLDTAIGAGLGAGAGALSAAFADKDEEGNKPWLSRTLGGAALGAGAANLVGDRARRYITNKVPMYGYDADESANALMPKSWNDFYQAAIADKRNFKPGTAPEPRIRHELLRRGMDLPPTAPGGTPYLASQGKKPYQPTETSGGLPGTFEHVQFSPEGYAKYLAETKHPDPGTAAKAYAADPSRAEAIGKGPEGDAWYDLLSRHGYRNNEDGTTSVHDLWDFALSPQEKALAVSTLAGREGPLNKSYPDKTLQKNNVGNWRSTLDLNWDQQSLPKSDILKMLASRAAMQSLTNGGVVLDQRFNPQTGQPVFTKQNAANDLEQDDIVQTILRRHAQAEQNSVDTTYHYHCDCGWTGTHTGKSHPRSQKCPDCGNPAHGGMPIDKAAGVHPFRPVNADPDFIQANQAWHDAEKAKMAVRPSIEDGWLDDFMRTLGLQPAATHQITA